MSLAPVSTLSFWQREHRRRFVPWLLTTATYDLNAVASAPDTRPFLNNPRHRLMYLPGVGSLGTSVMASFDSTKPGVVRLHLSLIGLSIFVRPPLESVPEFVQGHLPRGFEQSIGYREVTASSNLVADLWEAIAPGLPFTIVGLKEAVVHSRSDWARPAVEAVLRGVEQEGAAA